MSLLRNVVGESSPAVVHKILLCGAVGRTPALQTAVRNAFPNVQMLESIAQDEVLAYGCAVRIVMNDGMMWACCLLLFFFSISWVCLSMF